MIRVYDQNCDTTSYDADTLDTGGSELWVKKGGVVVAVYAPGRWINADVLPDEETP